MDRFKQLTSKISSKAKESRHITVVIVFFSLLGDSMLLTLVDPILPDILRRIDNATLIVNETLNDVIEDEISDTINFGGRFGYLIAAKAVSQFVCNPFVGLLISRYGYRRPMLVGSLLLLISNTAFAYENSYNFLFVTRIIQGTASAITAVTGMGLLASCYNDDSERGKVMGFAIGGLSLGITVGPVYGSVLYDVWGQAVPFMALSVVILFTIVLQVMAFKSEELSIDHSYLPSLAKLLLDPYIIIVAVNILLVNLDASVVLAFLPMHLIDLEDPPTWKLGMVVLPNSLGYLAAAAVFPRTTKWIQRWLCALVGLLLAAFILFILAFSNTFPQMLLCSMILGISMGMTSTSMQPVFAYLVDIRHNTLYANVYAISDMAVCLGSALGPLVGGPVEFEFGFTWLVTGIAMVNLGVSQFCLFLRSPTSKPKSEYIDISDKSYDTAFSSRDSGIDELIMRNENAPLVQSNKINILLKD